jgi:DNA-binding MarR family transcriptional regulator
MPRRKPFYDAADYPVGESVGYLIRRVGISIARSIDSRVAPYGLTDAQWGPLMLIRHGRARTARELAAELAVDPGAMTRLLDRMQAKGLIRRTPCEVDRRRVNIALTPAGERAAARVPAALADANNAHLEGFTREEFAQLESMLRRMLANDPARRLA